MKQVFERKEYCYGCGACAKICPVQAIKMKADEEGFLYPQIDEKQCIDCGKCSESCPFVVRNHYKNTKQPTYYAAKHRSEDVLVHSASGGAFTALSDVVLAEEGIVYGADFDQDFSVCHRRAQNAAERNRLRTSKYVQSDITDSYRQIEHDLLQGKSVLFSGTPCQNAGIKAYILSKNLGKNLYLCDLFCHSIPSPRIWQDFLQFLIQKHGAITAINFRSKNLPWSRPNCRNAFYFQTVADQKERVDNRFLRLFLEEGVIARPCCEHCQFTDTKRVGDITVGDYWGIEKYDANWYDPLGVSLLLVSSEKGERLLEKSAEQMFYEQRAKQEALAEQPRLREPIKFSPKREKFWQDYQQCGLEHILNEMK